MKFGKQLEEYELPEWKGHYFPYNLLKRSLEELAEKPGSRASSRNHTPLNTPNGLSRPGSNSWLGSPGAPKTQDAGANDSHEWTSIVESEAMRVGDFVERGLQGLEQQFKDLAVMAESLRTGRSLVQESVINEDATDDDEASFLELRVLQAVGRGAEGAHRIRAFAELNHAALYKILKKHDKQLSSKRGLQEIFPRIVQATSLADMSRLDALDKSLQQLSLTSSRDTEQLINASPEVARLIAGLGRSGVATGGDMAFHSTSRHRAELVLSFFLGSSVALFLAIGVLLALPEKSPGSFSEAYFLTPIPVFRVVFSILLSLWCMGAVARCCESNDINYMFILNVDPRCRVTPEFFFSRAAALTTLWILIFGMYVVDYKWRVVPPVDALDGYNKRASLHFVCYPVLLIFLTLLGILWPSVICRNRYKASVLKSVKRTAMAPWYPVDFADNVVGDVLTSLAKPMQDVPAAICYLMSHHPQEEELVNRFREKGDTCSEATHLVVLPIMAGLPFFFRAMQCLRRYRDTGGEVRHLLNFGKYVFSLIVVIVSWSRSTRLLIVVSTLATVYAWTWDVTLDWGLGPQDFCGSTTGASQESHAKVDVEEGEDSLQKLKRNPARKQTKTREKNPERQFPKRVYWLCAVVDLAGRFSWVLTLMPISLVTTNLVVRVVLVSIISSIEILRRSMWAVLRIEFEQVANASGFRALLWVPSKLNKPEDGGPSKGAAGAPVQPVQPRSGSTLSNLKLPAPVGVGGLQQPLLIQ